MLIEWRLGLGCGGWLVCESCSFQTLFSVRARKQPNALACLLHRGRFQRGSAGRVNGQPWAESGWREGKCFAASPLPPRASTRGCVQRWKNRQRPSAQLAVEAVLRIPTQCERCDAGAVGGL